MLGLPLFIGRRAFPRYERARGTASARPSFLSVRQPVFLGDCLLFTRSLLLASLSVRRTANLVRNIGLLLRRQMLPVTSQQIRNLQKRIRGFVFNQFCLLLFELAQLFGELSFGRGD